MGEELIKRNGPLCEPIRQRVAFKIFHHDEIDAIVMTDVMNDTNVRVIQ